MAERGTLLNFEVQFVVEECINCGIPFAMSEHLQRELKRNHKNFYCPCGHAQHYVGMTEEQRLRNQLTNQTMSTEYHRHRANRLEGTNRAIRGHLTRKKKELHRVTNGVCPCCNRHFENLERHMATKHPGYKG